MRRRKRKREDRGFQVPVLGGTFAAVPGTQLFKKGTGEEEGAVFSC